MMVEPPGDPTARTGFPPSSTIVGDIDERGRLPGPGRFGSGTPGTAGAKEKSVSSLLSRKPRPGTVIALPPVDSMVRVYDTTLPQRSATVRCVVFSPSYVVGAACPVVAHGCGERGSPGASGLVRVRSGRIRQARESANRWDSSSRVGTSSKAGSPTHRPRSAKEIREASMKRCRYCASDSGPRSVRSRMFSASPTVVPPEDEGAMLYTSSPR